MAHNYPHVICMPTRKHATSNAHSPVGGGGPIVYRGWIVPRGMAEASYGMRSLGSTKHLCGSGGEGETRDPHKINMHLEPFGTPHITLTHGLNAEHCCCCSD